MTSHTALTLFHNFLLCSCLTFVSGETNYSHPGPLTVTTTDPIEFSVSDQVTCVDDGGMGKPKDLCNVSLTVSYGMNPSGALPLALISPGFELKYSEYTEWAERLASYGYLVVSWSPSTEGPMHHVTHDIRAEMAVSVIDWAVQWSKGKGIAINDKNVFLAGHSVGGKTSVKTAESDSRVVGVLGVDPVDCGKVTGPISVPDYSPGYMPTAPAISASRASFAWIGSEYGSSRDMGMIPCAPAICNYQVAQHTQQG
jgi:hypothetical protein